MKVINKMLMEKKKKKLSIFKICKWTNCKKKKKRKKRDALDEKETMDR